MPHRCYSEGFQAALPSLGCQGILSGQGLVRPSTRRCLPRGPPRCLARYAFGEPASASGPAAASKLPLKPLSSMRGALKLPLGNPKSNIGAETKQSLENMPLLESSRGRLSR